MQFKGRGWTHRREKGEISSGRLWAGDGSTGARRWQCWRGKAGRFGGWGSQICASATLWGLAHSDLWALSLLVRSLGDHGWLQPLPNPITLPFLYAPTLSVSRALCLTHLSSDFSAFALPCFSDFVLSLSCFLSLCLFLFPASSSTCMYHCFSAFLSRHQSHLGHLWHWFVLIS